KARKHEWVGVDQGRIRPRSVRRWAERKWLGKDGLDATDLQLLRRPRRDRGRGVARSRVFLRFGTAGDGHQHCAQESERRARVSCHRNTCHLAPNCDRQSKLIATSQRLPIKLAASKTD